MNAFGQVKSWICLLAASCLLLFAGCATTDSKAIWDSRVGSFTYDDAVTDYGPPDKSAVLTDGTKVAEWMTQRGRSHGMLLGGPGRYASYSEVQTPDVFLRLTFDPAGKLREWKKLMR